MMLRAAVSVVGLVGLIANVLGEEDVSLSGPSGLRVHCSRRGARITVYRSVSNDTSTGTTTVSFSELTELDRDGKSVGGQFGGDFRHVFSALDKQNFTVSDPEDVVLPNSNQVNASCLTVKAVLHQNVSAANATTFTGHVCAVNDNGTLVLGDENSTVSAGQLKFTVRVNNWDWTTDGKYLQLKIDMRIPYGRTISEERLQSEQGRKLPKKFSFGGGATANFSTQVKVDDVWMAMPDGYPKYEPNGPNHFIIIRIPRCNSCEYDPSIDPGSAPETSPSKGSNTLSSFTQLGIIGFLMALLMQL